MDWKRKLGSRKFWAACASFIVAILTALRADPDTVQHVSAIIMAFSTLMVYILAEAYVDGQHQGGLNESKPNSEASDKNLI